MTMARIPVLKTPKCLVGGAFVRSEGGGVYPFHDSDGKFIANIPLCTRKDLRNAVEAAAKAAQGWAARSAYNRGQILYRLAEMLESRAAELAGVLAFTNSSAKDALREVHTSIERVTHYAGWTDKFQAVLGSVNPVASPHFNFTVPEPMGVVGVLSPEERPLLALLSMLLPAIVSGNTVVALASYSQPLAAIVLGEILAVSDLPAGVVNLLSGRRADLLPTFATHEHLRAVHAVVDQAERTMLQEGASDSVKRTVLLNAAQPRNWADDSMQGLYQIRDFVEFKTVWHPVGG
jgi:aldehyde dehydrogenase (NAD+)